MSRAEIKFAREVRELIDAAKDYAELIHVRRWPIEDMASGRAYERVRLAIKALEGK